MPRSPSRRPHDPVTSTWHGENWQLVEPEPENSRPGVEIGALWARGTLDERVEHAGSLVLVLEALAQALRRPGAVRADVQIGSDVCGLRLRGDLEEVRTAWASLPDLFTSALDTTDLAPGHVSELPWLEDVLLRTGISGAALQHRGFETEGTQDAAHRLLRELDPRRGDVPCVFWTDQESLVGAAFAVGPLRGARQGRRWADGTLRWRRDPDARPWGGNRASVVPVPELGVERLSMMVPRTADGLVAAELARSCLARTLTAVAPERTFAAVDPEHARVESRMTGMGEGLHVVLSSRNRFMPEQQPGLFTALLRALDALPGSAVEEALAHGSFSARCERERRVHGLPPATEPTVQGVHEALAGAERSLHVPLDPALLTLREHARLSALPVIAPAQEDPSAPAETYRASLRSAFFGDGGAGTWARLSRRTLHVNGSGMVHSVSPRAELPDSAVVDLTRVIAVWDQPRGEVWLLAHTGQLVRVSSGVLVGRKTFTRDLDAALHGVPRVTMRGWPYRRDRPVRSRPSIPMLVALGALALPFGFIGFMIHLQNSEPAWSEHSTSWTDTVELTNGTDITVREPVPHPVPSAGEDGEATVAVTVCGGIDSLGRTPAGETAEREVQNTVQSSDYALRGEGGAELTPVVAEEQPPVLLESKECTSFDLRYRGELGDQPVLVYTNAVGDEVSWF